MLLIVINDMKEYIRKTIDFYDQNIDEYYQKTLTLQDKFWLDKFVAYLPKGSRILDIGCAFGRDAKFFTDNGFDTTGIDLSENMVKKAKDFSPSSKFYVMDMQNLDFDNQSFDGIWCSAALLHLNKNDATLALKEIKRVLKKDGFLYLNLKEGIGEKVIVDERYQNSEKFYSYYQESEIKDLLSKFNFKIIDFEIKNNSPEKYRNTGIIYLIAQNQQ
jgi:ubiquinone/menaquinone biosynthesis C-methylase UbiE